MLIQNSQYDFWNNFPEFYSTPEKINKSLELNSKKIERMVATLFKENNLHLEYSLYANGGFGKQEMFPSSDIDISIIKNSNDIKNFDAIEKFIAKLWDSGFKIGHSVRTIKEVNQITKKDPKEFTSYLTNRPIITDQKINTILQKTLLDKWSKKKFFKAKILEQELRHKSFFSTQYNLEPNLKESPGGLRDFQNALWILHHCFELWDGVSILQSSDFGSIYKRTINSYNFIKTLRYATNLIAKSNTLGFESQIEISKKAKVKKAKNKEIVELMMQKYYENASNLSNFNNFVIESFKEKNTLSIKRKYKDFYLYGKKIGLNNVDLINNKNLIFDIFIFIGKNKKINKIDTFSSSLLRENLILIDHKFKNNQVYANKFIEILKSKYNLSSILKTMKDIGILQKYIPEFDEVVGQMQFDLFHAYTVDEHTFKLVRNMRQMKLYESKEFKLEYELINKLPKIEILYLAGFFHDLGKGKGGDHSIIGAESSIKFAKRMGLSLSDGELISWLVENHLLMSSISQKKDIYDSEIINHFVELVENTEKLDYLYLLTINDIKATNPALWNGWKHKLLKDLFLLARSKINKEPIKKSIEISQDRKNSVLKDFDAKNAKIINKFWSVFDEDYFNKYKSDKIKWHAELILKSKQDFIVDCKKSFDNLIEIFIKVSNRDGLFLKLVKALESSGLEIIDANISTSTDNAIAVNTFITKFSHHDRGLSKQEIDDIIRRIKKSFHENKPPQNPKRLNYKKSNFKQITKISNFEDKKNKRNFLTIETSNSPFLLSRIAKVLLENEASIYAARINTLGEKVEDTFEISSNNSSLITQSNISKISKQLREVI